MSDRQYKARCTQVEGEESSYALAYGKGSLKLTGTLKQREDGRWYALRDGDVEPIATEKKKRDALKQWASWAAAEYGSPVPPSTGSKPSAAAHAGPPVHRPPVASSDELSDDDRTFFKILSEKTGELNEWQRGMARNMFRRIGWPNRKPQDIITGNEPNEHVFQQSGTGSIERPAPPVSRPAPPAYRPPAAPAEAPATDDPAAGDSKEPSVSGG